MVGGARQRLAGLVLTALAIGAAPAAEESERLIVGARVERHEMATIEVLRVDEGFLVPLEPFTRVTGCRLEQGGTSQTLKTPLGALELNDDDTRLVDGVRYVSETFLADRLGMQISFDPEEYALDFVTPWSAGQTGAPKTIAPALTPDATPPGMTLSTLREDLLYTDDVGDGRLNSMATLGGIMGGGQWRVRFDNDFDGAQNLRDYAWYRVEGRNLFLVGRQTVHLHPLLSSVELTGFQAAWTNQPLEVFERNTESRELLPRRVQPAASFSGPAPPGSYAELSVDGVVLERQVVGIGGQYDFVDVDLPARQLAETEVRIYDGQHSSIPVAIHQRSIGASDYLLRRSAVVHMGGLGRRGNVADSYLGDIETEGNAGFYQGRFGLSDRVTVEAAAQAYDGDRQSQLGLTAKLSDRWFTSVAVGVGNGTMGYTMELEGHTPRWNLIARSRSTPAGFSSITSAELSDHRLETWYHQGPRLDVGLVAQYREESTYKTAFVLPSLSWRPVDRFLFRARPNYQGDYRVYASLRPGPRDRIIVTSETYTAADWDRELADRYRLSTGVIFGNDLDTRGSVAVHRMARGYRGTSWTLGLLASDGRFGGRVGATVALVPGILARVDYESIALNGLTGGGDEDRLVAGLTMDLTLAGRRLLPANSSAVTTESGAIAGRVRVADGSPAPDGALDGLAIRLDGRVATRTDRAGNFFVGNLASGIYVVELDTADLPVELVPRFSSLIAEVTRGASTRADFAVTPEYGVAGRVVDLLDTPLPRVGIEALDESGNVVGRAVTDRFGLYRMDGLPRGVYTLRIAPGSRPEETPTPTLQIRIVDEFLFGQDLQVPLDLTPKPSRVPTSDLTS